MKPLATLRAQLAAGEFVFTGHALRRVVERNISTAEIREAGSRAPSKRPECAQFCCQRDTVAFHNKTATRPPAKP